MLRDKLNHCNKNNCATKIVERAWDTWNKIKQVDDTDLK